jgi:hypothetical protein
MSGATKEDVGNVEAWAEVLEDVFRLIPKELRSEVFSLISSKKELFEGPAFPILSFANLNNTDTPGFRNWHTIMRLESLVVQVFARRVTNNNSKQDAAKLLFAEQQYGSGSGRLAEYIDDLPRD